MKRALKITAIVLLSVVAAIILAAVAYVIYVAAEYDRIEDNLALDIDGTASLDQAETDGVYRIVTYNIGFGAYTTDFSFFMDSGVMSDGTAVSGEYGKAIDKEHVLYAVNGASGVLKSQNADFIFVQEVDTDGDRSYNTNEYDMLTTALGEGYQRNFAVNFHSVDFDGQATGRARLASLLSQPKIDAEVHVRNFLFNGAPMGDLDIKSGFHAADF